MPEEKRKISVWVPETLYDNVLQAGYTSPTQAVIRGFEMLVNAQNEETPEEIRGQMQAIKKNMQVEIDNLKKEIERLNLNLQRSPDPLELAQLHIKSEELEKHNSTLKGELERAHQDKDNIQNLYDNYMRQMQTLIQQKAIKAPGEESKRWWKFW